VMLVPLAFTFVPSFRSAVQETTQSDRGRIALTHVPVQAEIW